MVRIVALPLNNHSSWCNTRLFPRLIFCQRVKDSSLSSSSSSSLKDTVCMSFCTNPLGVVKDQVCRGCHIRGGSVFVCT